MVFIFSRLREGDCGKILYLLRKGTQQMDLYRIGMLIGEFNEESPDGKTIYQAVVLQQNVESIMNDYQHILGTLHIAGQEGVGSVDARPDEFVTWADVTRGFTQDAATTSIPTDQLHDTGYQTTGLGVSTQSTDN